MSSYNPIFNLYPEGWKNKPDNSTPMKAEAMNQIDSAIRNIENFLSDNPLPTTNLNIFPDVIISNPKENDFLVYDENLQSFTNKPRGTKLNTDSEYSNDYILESNLSFIRGGYFTFADGLIIIDLQFDYLGEIEGVESFKIGGNFPLPSFPPGIDKAIGKASVVSDTNAAICSCYINKDGELYYRKIPNGFNTYGSDSSVTINICYIKG